MLAVLVKRDELGPMQRELFPTLLDALNCRIRI